MVQNSIFGYIGILCFFFCNSSGLGVTPVEKSKYGQHFRCIKYSFWHTDTITTIPILCIFYFYFYIENVTQPEGNLFINEMKTKFIQAKNQQFEKFI